MNYSAQWLIRIESGKQLGPYSTEAVLRLISEGTFTGLETVKRFPDGKWIPFSREPDFYDKLLDALSEKNLKFKSIGRGPKLDAETMIIKTTDLPLISIPDSPRPEASIPDSTRPEASLPSDRIPQSDSIPKSETQLVKTLPKPMPKKAREKKSETKINPLVIPLGLIAVAGVLAWFALDESGSGTVNSKKINLLSPRLNLSATLNTTEVKQAYQGASSLFIQDSFESYLEAQSKLVSIIEGSPQNREARGLLCLVYKELWPYAKQDSKDIEAIGALSRSARSLDPTGINSVYCDAMKMTTQGKQLEAKGIVEHALNQSAFSSDPILYALKAEFLATGDDPKSAVLYLEKVRQLSPKWVKPVVDQARYYALIGDPGSAYQNYAKALSLNANHKIAQAEMGILLFEKMKKAEEAQKVLLIATASSRTIPRFLEARIYFTLAMINLEFRNRSKAESYARQAFELNPGDPQIKSLIESLGGNPQVSDQADQSHELVFIGDQFANSGNFMAAQAEYKTAFDIDKTNAVAAMKAGKSLWQLNQSQEAISWLNRAVGADAKLVGAYLLLADYQSEKYNFVSALQALNRAQQIVPNNYEILRGFGLVELRRNNPRDALPYLQKAIKIYQHDIESLILLAKANTLLKDYQAAQSQSVKAIELDATHNEAQITYARVLVQYQGLDTGAMYLKDLINKFAYTLEFKIALAEIFREQERHKEAQLLYEQILDVNPKSRKAFIGLGQSLQGQGQFDKALTNYLNATVVDPSDAEGLVYAGLLYMDMQKYNEAITQFKRAKIVNPNYPKVFYYIGKAFFELGDYQAALNAAIEERKNNPGMAESYILAAEVYTAIKQFSKCTAEYQKALSIRSNVALLYVRSARCYRQSGSADMAEGMLSMAAAKESGLADIYREQGAVFEVKGDLRAAEAAYSKYLALSPNAPDKKEVEARLQMIDGQR